jgi:ProP effector
VHGSHTESHRTAQATTIIGVLADLYPKTFTLYMWRRAPLKIGVFHDLLSATAGAITPNELHAALHRYCTSTGYLAAMREGAGRLDLNGNIVGTVTAEEAAHAALALTACREREASRRCARAAASQPPPSPKKLTGVNRLSLADLRAAARARREAAS